MRKSGAGQAVVEFVSVVLCMVIVMMLLGLLGQMLQVRLKTAHAANFVLWGALQGVDSPKDGMRSDIVRRFLTSGGGDEGAGWRTAHDLPLVDEESVRVDIGARADGGLEPLRPVADNLALPTRGLKVVRVRVRLKHLDEYKGMPGILEFEERVAGLSDAWQGRSPADITRRLEKATWLYPYPSAQKGVTHTVNGVLRLLFGEVKADTHLVRPDVVPADRLVPYAP